LLRLPDSREKQIRELVCVFVGPDGTVPDQAKPA
jgi:hypothetical protein